MFKRSLVTMSRIYKSAVLEESYEINQNFYKNSILLDTISLTKDLHYITLTKKIIPEGSIYKVDKKIIKKITSFNNSQLTLYVNCQNSSLVKNNLVKLFDDKFYKYNNDHYIGDKNIMMDDIIDLIKNEN